MDETPRRWFTTIPLAYNDDPAFWFRDAGALCLAFQKLGVDSRFVALGEPGQRKDMPVVTCTLNQMQDPVWWRQWDLEGVVLSSWGAPRFEPIARAIKESGAKLVVRLDSDGLKSPRIHFRRFLATAYCGSKDAKVHFPLLNAALKTLLFRYLPSTFDRPTCAHLGHADVVIVESPLGKQYLRRYFLGLGRADLAGKLRVLPHPAKAEKIYDPAIPKRPKILAVGRWESAQKDGPKLMRVLGMALPHHPEYSVVLAGSGAQRMEKLRALLPRGDQERIEILGPVDHATLHRHYQEAQIVIFTSRTEGFPFTASEALCCGCTIVGAALLPSMNYISSQGAGTLAITRSSQDYADALEVEMDAWQRNERDPRRTSLDWHKRVSVEAVASTILSFFTEP